MGPEQYVAHKGTRDGKSTSGALLWALAEEERASAKGNMVNAETNLLRKVAEEIGNDVPDGIAVIELGPGTAAAFKNKTLPIIEKLQSDICVLVDESKAFLDQISSTEGLPHRIQIKSVIDDFFENDLAYFPEEALVCSFGSTVSNILNPISALPPRVALVDSLSKLAHAANNGWMLVGFDSDKDGERIKTYFRQHSLFQLNVFDRMACELPIQGDFDPKAFSYKPEWIAASGQLAHIAVVGKDMKFSIAGQHFFLNKDRELHIKNSYKFAPKFFENCCLEAGLEVLRVWSDDSSAKIYLLKISRMKSVMGVRTPTSGFAI
jgi:uncharacterized SAM-dependent methyltransferase